MNDKAKVGTAVALGALAGISIGLAQHQIGAWVGMGVAIGAAIGLAITKRKN